VKPGDNRDKRSLPTAWYQQRLRSCNLDRFVVQLFDHSCRQRMVLSRLAASLEKHTGRVMFRQTILNKGWLAKYHLSRLAITNP
jgi:hypothetical protein